MIEEKQSSNYRFIYKRQSPFLVYLVGGSVLFWAVTQILSSPLAGLFLGLCSTGILSYKRGIEIDFENRRYKYFTAFGPQEFGDWENIGSLKYVSVFAANYVNTVQGVGAASASVNNKLFEVNLITENNLRINICTLKDIEVAFEQAHIMASKLSLKIYDATTREPKWLD